MSPYLEGLPIAHYIYEEVEKGDQTERIASHDPRVLDRHVDSACITKRRSILEEGRVPPVDVRGAIPAYSSVPFLLRTWT